jgi:hypothetical protein
VGNTYVYLEDGVVNETSAELVHAKLGFFNCLRILKEEYEGIDPLLPFFSHFNIEFAGNPIGKRYALPKILVQGYYRSDEDELPPLLSFDGMLYGMTTNVRDHIPYERLTPEDFRYSMRHIKTPEELKLAILARYRVSMPHVPLPELLTMGVAITTIKLERE